MPSKRRSNQYRFIPDPEQTARIRQRVQDHRRQQRIDTWKPLLLDGDTSFGLRRVLVFPEAGQIVMSIIGNEGSVNVPLSRKLVGDLVASLSKCLAMAEPAGV